MQNLVIVSCLAVAASAYDYSGPGLATWPSAGGLGYGSTVWGAHGYRIGKRSAEPFYGYGAALTLENRNNVHGHELASGYAINQPHPGLSTSYQQRTQLHSGYGKRDAEPFYGYGAGIAVHPGVATSFVARSPQGLHGYYGYGKRSADADAFYSGPGLATWPSAGGLGYTSTVWGAHGYRIGKRDAEPFYGYGAALTFQNRNNVHGHELASGYAINQPHPGFSSSYQQRTQLHSGYGKRDAEPFYGYGAALTLENRNNVHGHELASGYAISQPHPSGGSYQNVNRLHSGLSYGLGYVY